MKTKLIVLGSIVAIALVGCNDKTAMNPNNNVRSIGDGDESNNYHNEYTPTRVSLTDESGNVYQDGKKITNNVYQGGKNVANDMYHGGKNVANDMYHGGKNVANDVYHGGKNVANDVYHGGKKVANDVGNNLNDVGTDIQNGTTDLVRDMPDFTERNDDLNSHGHLNSINVPAKTSYYTTYEGKLAEQLSNMAKAVPNVSDARAVVYKDKIIVAIIPTANSKQVESAVEKKLASYAKGRTIDCVSNRGTYYQTLTIDNNLRDGIQMNPKGKKIPDILAPTPVQ